MKQTDDNKCINPIDELIIKGLKSSDQEIHDVCVNRFFYVEMKGIIEHIRFALFKGTADYDELVNELYILLSRNEWSILDSYKGIGGARLATWVRTVAWHHFTRQCIKNDRLETTETMSTFEREGVEVISSDEIRLDVNRVIAIMPNRRYAGVLSMNLVYGYSAEEIARILEITVSNVYNIKHRAIRMFLEIYKETH